MPGKVEEDDRVGRNPLRQPAGQRFFKVGPARQFILEQQAQTGAQLQQLTAGVREQNVRWGQQAASEARQIDAIAKLIQVGMKMLVKMEKNMEERDRVTDQKIQALGKRIDRLVAGLQRASGNGG